MGNYIFIIIGNKMKDFPNLLYKKVYMESKK